ncbi:MAG: hypothetical protein J6T10_03345 [Methanobrevibacter sp.]|nr:hypothetical protein [Methanobrevibacter sp.]
MLKNYKPYNEYDLSVDDSKKLIELTSAELSTIISDLGDTYEYDLASATNLSDTEIKSTYNLTELYGVITSKKFTSLTVRVKLDTTNYIITLNKNGQTFITTLQINGATVLFLTLFAEDNKVKIWFSASIISE